MAAPRSYMEVITGGFCQFIKGDPKKSPIFCGEKPKHDSVYCEAHHKLCYKPPEAKEKKDDI